MKSVFCFTAVELAAVRMCLWFFPSFHHIIEKTTITCEEHRKFSNRSVNSGFKEEQVQRRAPSLYRRRNFLVPPRGRWDFYVFHHLTFRTSSERFPPLMPLDIVPTKRSTGPERRPIVKNNSANRTSKSNAQTR